MLPHGGPFGAYDTAGFDWLAQAFASRGYAVFQPNYRGSGGYGSAFELAGHGEFGGKMQTDISDGLAELVKQGVRRQNIRHRLRRKLAEDGPRLGLGFKRRAYGVASADVRWFVA
jgi:hypothetical protein